MKLKIKSLFYFYIAVYPIIPVYLGIGGVSFYVYFNMVFASLLFLYSMRCSGKLFNKTTIFFVMYVLSLTLSHFLHGNYVYVLKTITSMPLIVVAFFRFIKTEDDLVHGIDVTVKMGCILGIFGIIESITHFNVFSLLNTMGGTLNYNELRLGMMRILSFTSQTLTYADYATMIACLAFYRITTSMGKEKRRFTRIYAIMCVNVILTFSRSIILVFVISQVILFIYCDFWKFVRKAILSIIIAIVAITIASFAFPSVRTAVDDFLYMFLAVINDDYAASVAGSVDNTAGIGHRFLLYGWVWNSVKENLLFGQGLATKFSYTTGALLKSSIEVQYLYTLFHNGLISMITEILMYVGLLVSCNKYGGESYISIERNRLTFGKTCFALFLSQILSYFAVMQDTIERMFYIIVFLFFAYVINIVPAFRKSIEE